MAKLTILTWFWGNKYGKEYVEKLSAGLRRHVKQPYHFVVVYPDSEDHYLTQVPGCFVRLRMFDPVWQGRRNLDKFVCVDLDVVITGDLDPLFGRPEPFVILAGANSVNPCPYNGSLMMLQAGAYPEVWWDFSLDEVKAIPYYEFPDDQGWIAHKLPNAATWQVGPESGVYAYRKPKWPPLGDRCPADARLVVFPGSRDPKQVKHLPWVRDNWRI